MFQIFDEAEGLLVHISQMMNQEITPETLVREYGPEKDSLDLQYHNVRVQGERLMDAISIRGFYGERFAINYSENIFLMFSMNFISVLRSQINLESFHKRKQNIVELKM